MIGVVVDPVDEPIVREFFQLFKTDWEFRRPGGRYDVLICSSGQAICDDATPLVIVYGTNRERDGGAKRSLRCTSRPMLGYRGDRIPIYGGCTVFPGSTGELVDELTGQPAMSCFQKPNRIVRIGYNLFHEIRFLLEKGQPGKYAHIPTLELHIAVLRDLLQENRVAFAEVPPVPAGYDFIVCLTHDVDHAAVRSHGFGHAIAGFIWRGLIGSLIEFVRGRKRVSDLLTNWLAVLRLPLVYLRVVPDFWSGFDRYSDIEGDLPSTYFIIPKSKDAGRGGPARRAVSYRLSDIQRQVHELSSTHHEIGVHGIDAWCDRQEAAAELATIQEMIGSDQATSVSGVRMHWLYHNETTPEILERAGYDYDSTMGYNDAVGYRAGTCQAYKPLQLERLLELPLHVMDTALLFPDRMDLSPTDAKSKVDMLIANAQRFGGVLTINWHDRSIAPERLWGGLYAQILAELKRHRVWFATGSEAVAWFNKRRAANLAVDDNLIREEDSEERVHTLAGLFIKSYNRRKQSSAELAA